MLHRRSPRPSSQSSGFRLVCPPLTWWEITVDESGGSSISLERCLHTKAGVKINVLMMSALSVGCLLPTGLWRQVSWV